jgi:hypothetical protein
MALTGVNPPPVEAGIGAAVVPFPRGHGRYFSPLNDCRESGLSAAASGASNLLPL